MKTTDIEKIHAAGLISVEQRDGIIAHFGLKDEGGRFLVIVSFLGAILVAAGIALLIGAHWDEIPRGVKLATGIALLLGAHGAGWWLRSARKIYPRTGEALHFAGSLLFLANIALVGQIYHLSARPANAFLLWWLGIAALPWLLRSAAQFALLLLAISIWFGVEINDASSLILFNDEHQVLAYALVGLVFTGFGFLLRRGRNRDFSAVAETFGLLAFAIFAYPLTWAGFLSWGYRHDELNSWLLPALGAFAALLVALGCRNLTALPAQWRITWGATLASAAALLVTANYVSPQGEWHWFGHMTPLNTVAAIAFFVFGLLQVRVGVPERSRFLVNLGVLFVALDIIAVYLGLFGSMAFTGLMFIVSGVFLILFAVFLEQKRRLNQADQNQPGGQAMKTKLLIFVLALQSAWILGTVAVQERILRVGQVILLETQPVDPRDLLRGDYVRLNYPISTVPRERFFAPPLTGELSPGTTVFVALVPAGTNGFYQLARASTEWFTPASNEVILRGRAAQSWRSNAGSVHVEYGLEQYFVAEGTGNPHGRLTVQAAVTKAGRAGIKEVFVDGKPYAEVMKKTGD